MGTAVIAAYSGVTSPEEITEAHAADFEEYLLEAIYSPVGQKSTNVLFTVNFPSTHPSMAKDHAARLTRELLGLYRQSAAGDAPSCCFCGRPSLDHRGSPLGMRDRIPLFPGRDAINFYPYGRTGLPVCGSCFFAVLALTVGAPLVSGRALIVDAERPDVLFSLVNWWLPYLRDRILLSCATGEVPGKLGRPLANLVHALVGIADRLPQGDAGSVSLYHLSNSGNAPDFQLHQLTSGTLRLTLSAQRAALRPIWRRLARRGRDTEEEDTSDGRWISGNLFYDAVARLPESFPTLLRSHFFTAARDRREGEDGTDAWPLLERVLVEVMDVDAQRIAVTRQLADELAASLEAAEDRGLFGRLFRANSYYDVRRLLLNASLQRVRRGERPVVSFDDFVRAFEDMEDLPRFEWRLTWDLVLVRLLDRLWDSGWLSGHEAALADSALEGSNDRVPEEEGP